MPNDKALSGIRVLDFTHFLAGPFCTLQLALQGADVIKVESPHGDEMRVTPTSREWSERKLGPTWMAVNANKRCMRLDLRKPQAAEVVRDLAREVDVVCENFRPGVMERLGIGWPQLSAINPRLVYCAISGFGQTGPQSQTAAFDGKIQAMSGLMTLTGEPVNGPMRAGFAVADTAAGMMAAFGVTTALVQRQRTGRGQWVDVAMLDTLLAFLAPQVAEYTVAGFHHTQFGNLSVSRKPTANRFRCGDGWLVLAVLTEKQFQTLMQTLGLQQVLADPRFADWYGRREHGNELHRLIESAMTEGTAGDWERRLTEADIPCASVMRIDEVAHLPQLEHRRFFQSVSTPYGPVTLPGPGFRLEHGSPGIDRPMALPGEHTDEVLRSIGYAEDRIRALRADGVI